MTFDKNKFFKFCSSIKREYERSKSVSGIASVQHMPQETKGTYIQIAIRPLIAYETFETNSNFAPDLAGAGKIISIGERDFVIRTLLNNEKIKRFKISSLTVAELIHAITQSELHALNPVTIIDYELFHELQKDINFIRSIEYRENGNIYFLNKYLLIPVPTLQNNMKNKILVIDKDAIILNQKMLKSEDGAIPNTIQIIYNGKNSGKADITIKSVNEIVLWSEDSHAVFEISSP
jgi:hypothetical protein